MSALADRTKALEKGGFSQAEIDEWVAQKRSALAGAGFLVLADLGARTLLSPAELPIGVITAFVGAPSINPRRAQLLKQPVRLN